MANLPASMLLSLLSVVAFVHLTQAVDLTFASEVNCTGIALYGRQNITATSCYDLTYEDSAQSVILANVAQGQVVSFFADSQCEEFVNSVSEDLCVSSFPAGLGSFTIGTTSNTKELVVRNETLRLSNYKDLAQTSPYQIELRYPHGFVGTTLLTLSYVTALGSAAIGCYSAKTGEPLSVTGCVLGVMSSVLAYLGSKILADYGTDFLFRAGASLGIFTTDIPRRAVENVIEDFMFSMYTDKNDTFVGYTTRNTTLGFQTSPVHKFTRKGVMYHHSAYLATGGDMIQHFRPAGDDSHIHTRETTPAYGVTTLKDGGVDVRVCPMNQGYWGNSANGWSDAMETDFDFLHLDVECLNTGGQYASAAYIQTDMYSADSVLLAQIQMSFDTGTATDPPDCPNTSARLNTVCIN